MAFETLEYRETETSVLVCCCNDDGSVTDWSIGWRSAINTRGTLWTQSNPD